jgi:hypothetical protein
MDLTNPRNYLHLLPKKEIPLLFLRLRERITHTEVTSLGRKKLVHDFIWDIDVNRKPSTINQHTYQVRLR